MSGIRSKQTRDKGKPFHVFHRTWWKRNEAWPNGLEPSAGKKSTIGFAATAEEARSMCQVWAAAHRPGKLSDKPEFEEL